MSEEINYDEKSEIELKMLLMIARNSSLSVELFFEDIKNKYEYSICKLNLEIEKINQSLENR